MTEQKPEDAYLRMLLRAIEGTHELTCPHHHPGIPRIALWMERTAMPPVRKRR